MRQFIIDELSNEERANLDTYLKKSLKPGGMEGMFWLQIPDDLLAEAQQGHEECGPFFFALDLARDKLIIELLVRSESNLHCSCISYATKAQRDFLLEFTDEMLAEEHIKA
ncbi:MAG: hypothetical protein KQH63_06665 [Desulfobulbaceae bacterium]|nr:hypothetical protein [Desulfobulbaceae bacterium]